MHSVALGASANSPKIQLYISTHFLVINVSAQQTTEAESCIF